MRKCRGEYKASGNKCVRKSSGLGKKFKKNPLFLVLGIIAVVALISASVYFGVKLTNPLAIVDLNPTNLIKNPGFDMGSSYLVTQAQTNWLNNDNYWVISNSSDSKHLASLDTSNYYSSSASLHLSVVNGSKSFYRVWGNRVATTPGTTYLVSMYVRTANLASATGLSNGTGGYPDRFMMEMQEFNSLNNETSQRIRASYALGVSGDSSSHATWDSYKNKGWTKLSGTYTVGSSATFFRPALFFYTTNGDVWFDDITIQAYNIDTNKVISNPSFEMPWTTTSLDTRNTTMGSTQVTTGWYCGQFGGVCSRSSDAQEGSYSFNVTTRTYLGQELNSPSLVKGHRYEVSAYMKGGVASMHVQREDPWDGDDVKVTYSGGNTWKLVTANFVASTDQKKRLVFEPAQSQFTSVLVDNVNMVDLGVATACSSLSGCGTTETCVSGYCNTLSCVNGYHAENHVCVEGEAPVETPTNYTLWIIIGAIVAVVIAVILFFALRRKK